MYVLVLLLVYMRLAHKGKKQLCFDLRGFLSSKHPRNVTYLLPYSASYLELPLSVL